MKNLFWILSSLLFLGCHANPYSGVTGNFSPTLKESKPVITDSPIKAQSFVDATEGQSMQVNVRGFVQNGQGNFTFENLPSWVSFDRGQLTISPPLGASSAVTNGEYTFNIVLTSNIDATEKYKKDFTVIVHKAALALQADYNDTALVHEGEFFQSEIHVRTTNLPVVLALNNAPEGFSVTPTSDPTVFEVRYTPPYNTVTYYNHGDQCMDTDGITSRWCNATNWSFTIVDSQGNSKTVTPNWKVLDIRQNPIIRIATAAVVQTVSQSSAQGGQAGTITAIFSLDVEDPNGESSPDVSIQRSDLGGNFNTDVTAAGNGVGALMPYSLVRVTWSNIPGQARNTSQTVNIVACVTGGPTQQQHCATIPTAINL